MTTGLTVEDLTTEQQEKLTALLDRLKDFPPAEMIVRCAEAMGNLNSEAHRVRADTAMAAAWAHDRMLLYLVRLRFLNEERMEIGNQIRNLPRFLNPKVEENYAGITRIEKIIKSSSEKFEERALQQVQDHFIGNPNNIPLSNSVCGDLLLSVERFGS